MLKQILSWLDLDQVSRRNARYRRLQRIRPWTRALRLAELAAIAVLAVAFIVALVGPITDVIAVHDVNAIARPLRAAQLQVARESARTEMLTLGAGVFAAGALIYTARNFRLSREGQVTDRYTKAIEQLGSDKLDVRIGGIYAAERVARDSARDYPTVISVLAAFVREHSSEQWPPSVPGTDTPDRTTRPDVQAALTVIGRRDPKHDRERINLARSYLPGADISDADLFGADLTGAKLAGADLSGANLIEANLTHADLSDASLIGTNLMGARLTRANLTDATLGFGSINDVYAQRHHGFVRYLHETGANLSGADLSQANLSRADLTGADLRDVTLWDADLTDADLSFAVFDNLYLASGANFSGVRLTQGSSVPRGWFLDPSSGKLMRTTDDPNDTA